MSASLDQHNWYMIRDRKKVGPLPWTALCTLAADGQLRPGDMILCEGQTRWIEAGSLPGLFPAPVAEMLPEATLAPPLLPSATMFSDRVADDTQKSAFVAPVQLPGYELLDELGRGGMGVVYKARQQKASRVVALKMILSGAHAGKEDLARFQTEAEAVARLQHPHIVQVYEIGEHEGRPYFSLEYCGGGTLDRKLRDNPLLPKDAARLAEVLARAMHHAHTHHILHRDLKPANVLLTEDGVPKITDFGLAKKLDETGQTASGAVMGTPPYMSPEQASGKARHLTPSTDVYALGALLYDCLAGRPPFRAATALDTILQVITDAPVPPAHLNPKVPGDLQTICLKCLEKNPAHRYATAEELAEDLRRFTSGEPIQARPAGWLERSWKWARRRPAAAALVAVSVFALAFLVVASLAFSVRVGHERNAAIAAAAQAELERGRAEDNEKEAKSLRKQAEEREEGVQKALDKAQRTLMTSQVGRASAVWQRDPLQALQFLQEREACPPALRDFAWGYYHHLCLQWQPQELKAVGGNGVGSLAVSPDGSVAAAMFYDGTVQLFDLNTFKERTRLSGHTSGIGAAVAFHPNSTWLATGGADKVVRLWDVADGKEVAALRGHTGAIEGVAFSPDGKWLVSGSGVYHNLPEKDRDRRHRDGEVRLWNLATNKEEKLLFKQDSAVRGVAFSLDSRTVAACTTYTQSVYLIDVATSRVINKLEGENGWVYRVAFGPDGQQVAWTTAQPVVHLASPRVSRPQRTLRGHQKHIFGLAWAPDGKSIASSDMMGNILLWDADTGKERLTMRLPGDPSGVDALAFTPDGRSLLTGHQSGRVVRWHMAASPDWLHRPGSCTAVTALRSPTNGTLTLAATTTLSTLLLREQETSTPSGAAGKESILPLDKIHGTSLAASPDGKLLAVGVIKVEGRNYLNVGECQLWDMAERRRLTSLKLPSGRAVANLIFTRDGQTLVTAYEEGPLTLWNVAERKEGATLQQRGPTASALALSPDGKVLAAALGMEVKLWDLERRRELAVLRGHNHQVSGVGFLDGGRTLVSVGLDRLVQLWDVAQGKPIRALPHQLSPIMALAVSADGQTIALGCHDRNVRLWDVASGQQRALLSGFTRELAALTFTPDGQFLVAASSPYRSGVWEKGGELKVWKSAVVKKP